MLCARVFSSEAHDPVGVAEQIPESEEPAVVVCDEVELVQPERIGQPVDALHLG